MYALHMQSPSSRSRENSTSRQPRYSRMEFAFEDKPLDLSFRFAGGADGRPAPSIEGDEARVAIEGQPSVSSDEALNAKGVNRVRRRLVKHPRRSSSLPTNDMYASAHVASSGAWHDADDRTYHTEDFPVPPNIQHVVDARRVKRIAGSNKPQIIPTEPIDPQIERLAPTIDDTATTRESVQTEPLQKASHNQSIATREFHGRKHRLSEFGRGLARFVFFSAWNRRSSTRGQTSSLIETVEDAARNEPFGRASVRDTPSQTDSSHRRSSTGRSKSDTGSRRYPPAPEQELPHETSRATAPSFLTDEALQHDRARFANAFRSRIEQKGGLSVRKPSAGSSTIRGGWSDGSNILPSDTNDPAQHTHGDSEIGPEHGAFRIDRSPERAWAVKDDDDGSTSTGCHGLDADEGHVEMEL